MVRGEDKNLGGFEGYGREQGGDFFRRDEMMGSDKNARRSRNVPTCADVPGGFKKTGRRNADESGGGEGRNVLRRKRRAFCTPNQTQKEGGQEEKRERKESTGGEVHINEARDERVFGSVRNWLDEWSRDQVSPRRADVLWSRILYARRNGIRERSNQVQS